MFSRITAICAAVVVAGLAIGIPYALSEARTRSTSDGLEANANFSYVNPATGEQAYGYVSGREQTYAERSGSGSQRATFTSKTREVYVYVERFAEDGQFLGWADGFADPSTLQIDPNLGFAAIEATVEVYQYDSAGEFVGIATALVDIDVVGTGTISNSRDRYHAGTRSPRSRYQSVTVVSSRDAQATGLLRFDSGPNIAADGSTYASLLIFSSRTSSSP